MMEPDQMPDTFRFRCRTCLPAVSTETTFLSTDLIYGRGLLARGHYQVEMLLVTLLDASVV